MLMDNPNNLNVGMRCIKYMIFLINFMFLLTGALIIVVGITINALYDYFENFLYDHFYSPPTLLVVIGIFILAISFFGVVGAVKESACWINVYGMLLLVVLVLQIAAAISAYVMQGQVHDMLATTMKDTMMQYEKDDYMKETVDFLQSSLECCGIDSPTDWEHILKNEQNDTRILVPPSCCASFSEASPGDCEMPYQDGCLLRLRFLIAQGSVLIATSATAIALVQMLGVICAFMLSKAIRQTKSLREARRQQFQQSLAVLTEPYYSIADDTDLPEKPQNAEYQKIYNKS